MKALVLLAMVHFFHHPLSATHEEMAAKIDRAAALANVPALLLTAVAAGESSLDNNKVGAAGEIGLMQILPGSDAAAGHSVEELRDPDLNLSLGAAWLSKQSRRCHSIARGLGAYNGGGCRVSDYSRRVLRRYAAFRWASRHAASRRDVAMN